MKKKAKVGLVINIMDEDDQLIHRVGQWIDPATNQWDREAIITQLVDDLMPELDAALDDAFAYNRA